jgi:hypothetical protein
MFVKWSNQSPSRFTHINSRRISTRSKYITWKGAIVYCCIVLRIHVHDEKNRNSLARFIIQKGPKRSLKWIIIDIIYQWQSPTALLYCLSSITLSIYPLDMTSDRLYTAKSPSPALLNTLSMFADYMEITIIGIIVSY